MPKKNLNTLIIRIYKLIDLVKLTIKTRQLEMTCKFWGIDLGLGCRFWGPCKFLKHPGSVMKFGDGCRFRSGKTSNLIGINHLCIFSTQTESAKLRIGNNCGFSGTTIGCFKEIIIGDNVMCGANTLITDSDWHSNDPRVGPPKPVRIGNNVWLGYGAIVLKGVTIGENTIIGAGSVVVKDIPANVIAAGNPCKVIKAL